MPTMKAVRRSRNSATHSGSAATGRMNALTLVSSRSSLAAAKKQVTSVSTPTCVRSSVP